LPYGSRQSHPLAEEDFKHWFGAKWGGYKSDCTHIGECVSNFLKIHQPFELEHSELCVKAVMKAI
jgi:hypothetical protein